jgi:DNA-directed RNA polymerase specialized sigma24 family protein
MLALVHRYTAVEIAAITSAPVNTVRDRLAKAKKALRQRIGKDPVLRQWVDSEER